MAKPPKKKDDPKKQPGKPGDRVADAIDKFQPFLTDNPTASISEINLATGAKSLRILSPWGDPSLAFRLSEDDEELAGALNAVRLPVRLSAIWHKDLGSLEVIWTALKLPVNQNEIVGRSFTFKYKNKTHECSFGDSSNRLISIAKSFVAVTNSSTWFRNIRDIYQYTAIPEERRAAYGVEKPRSFWITNVKWNEEEMVELASNLSFYLTYYDDRCPLILIHDPPETEKVNPRTRYVRGAFPKEIDSSDLDKNMLSYWLSADSGSPMMRFLLYFRIIEYAATHYIDRTTKSEIHKLLLSPDIKSCINETIEKIVGTVNIAKLEDTQRFKAVIRACVDPKLLWRDVKENLAFFAKDTKFDGGFTVKALVDSTTTEETFCPRGADNFSDSIRKIRNALAHGKDLETSGVITPSTRNVNRLRPWVHLIATAAGEVVLYKDAS